MPNISEIDNAEKAALEAQVNLNRSIATNNIENLRLSQRLEKIGGDIDYTYTILEALRAFDGTVNLSFLTPVLADHIKFAKARKMLIEEGKITETQEKNRKVLKLVNAA